MKKKVLLSVLAAGLVLPTASVLAQDNPTSPHVDSTYSKNKARLDELWAKGFSNLNEDEVKEFHRLQAMTNYNPATDNRSQNNVVNPNDNVVDANGKVVTPKDRDDQNNANTTNVTANKNAEQRKLVRQKAGEETVKYLELHRAELEAQAAKDPAVVKAQADLDAFMKSGYAGHDYQEKKDALEKALAEAKQNAFNKVYKIYFDRILESFIQQLLNGGTIGFESNETREASNAAKNAAKAAQSAKAGNKALPKTSAVK